MPRHKVYFIHGLLGFSFEFLKLKKTLSQAGFETEFLSYRSRTQDLFFVAEKFFEKIRKDKVDSVSFVTHSMGALALRAMFTFIAKDDCFPKIHRMVMIAPPNQGAESANSLYSMPLVRFLMGCNLKYLCTKPESPAKLLPVPAQGEIGIIAGIHADAKGYNPFLDDNNDGEIKLEETKLGTEKDFATVNASHLFIMQNKKTVMLTANFLKTGKFRQFS